MPTTIDLKKLARELGSHFDQTSVDEVEGQCKCGEWVSQEEAFCPLGHPIIWKGSKLWRDLFLAPHDRKDRLLLGVASLTSGHQYHKWLKLKDQFGEAEIREVVAYCIESLAERGRYTRRALIPYVLNILAHKAGDEDDQSDDEVVRVTV